VFGKPKTNTDFLQYNGDGFKLMIPSKWNPSKEVECPGQVLRYEDNFDSNSNVVVAITPTDKKSITDYGSPEEFLSQVSHLSLSLSHSLSCKKLNVVMRHSAGELLAGGTSLLWKDGR